MDENQFDATVGGTEHLPFSANSLKFAAARSIEIAAMTESILRPSQTKLIFQTLPVHMRRRVMSHNCKRLPRSLREGHLEQLKKSGSAPKQKRPPRKYRRRPTNLLQEYTRRQRTHVWLETHIWHAKRFHMIERWGHRMALAPCDKAFRACYRASSAHCLLQDLSYFSCVQITGNIEHIASGLENMFSSNCGLGICSKAFISGSRIGLCHLFRPRDSPCGYIGQIQFLWSPGNEIVKVLWMFVHPSQYDEVVDAVNKSLKVGNKQDNYEVPEKKIKVLNENDTRNVNVTCLKNQFNRFRLTGPNSHAVLIKSLQCISNIKQIETNDWVKMYSSNCTKNLHLQEKYNYWQDLKHAASPAQLPSGLTLGLVVRDPRLIRPKYRTKARVVQPDELPASTTLNIPSHACYSPLWDHTIHGIISAKKLTTAQFLKNATEKQLIPGEVDIENSQVQSVPVLLAQRPGSQDSKFKKVGYGSGWDIIMPAGYGLPFWQTFIMFGARAGGLRETESLAFEIGECYLPPDSEAGELEERRVSCEMHEKYFKLPPNRRVNYTKLGIRSPFLCRWKLLLSDWAEDAIDKFFVLRDRIKLKQIQDCIDKKKKNILQELDNMCLVPLYVQIRGKGTITRHSLICLPKPEDFKEKVIFEPSHSDPNEKLRKQLRQENKEHIKRTRRKKVCLKKQGVALPTVASKSTLSEYVHKMRELWLPSNVSSVRASCSREVLGFVSQGAFSFTEAHACGVGYVALAALQALLTTGNNSVLIRNTTSKKYSFASIHVIMP